MASSYYLFDIPKSFGGTDAGQQRFFSITTDGTHQTRTYSDEVNIFISATNLISGKLIGKNVI